MVNLKSLLAMGLVYPFKCRKEQNVEKDKDKRREKMLQFKKMIWAGKHKAELREIKQEKDGVGRIE